MDTLSKLKMLRRGGREEGGREDGRKEGRCSNEHHACVFLSLVCASLLSELLDDEDAPSLGEVSAARAALNAARNTNTPVEPPPLYGPGGGQKLKPSLMRAVAATTRPAIHEALLHTLTLARDLQQNFTCPPLSTETAMPAAPLSPSLRAEWLLEKPAVPCKAPTLWRRNGGSMRLLHGDMHPGNLMVTGTVGSAVSAPAIDVGHIDHECIHDVTTERLHCQVGTPDSYVPLNYRLALARDQQFQPDSQGTDSYGMVVGVALAALADMSGCPVASRAGRDRRRIPRATS